MIKIYINTNNNIYRQIIEYKNKQRTPQIRERKNMFRQEVVVRWVDISGIV